MTRAPLERAPEERHDIRTAPRTVVERLGGVLTAITAVLIGGLLGLASIMVVRLIWLFTF